MTPIYRCLVVLALATAVAPARGDEPLVAGQNDVPVPKRTKMVSPQYPPDAQEQGLRGIVILEVVIDAQGKVQAVQVIRSVPPFDEAAIGAVRQWEYEPTKVDGKPVSVKFTVPILFAMKLPEITQRQEGIPELRAGAIPPVPPDVRERTKAAAEVTLGADGAVEELQVVEGPPSLADLMSRALRTWRFALEPNEEGTLTFRVTATFVPGDKPAGKVQFSLDGLRRASPPGQAAAAATPPAAPVAPADSGQASEPRPAPAPAQPPAAAPPPVIAPPPAAAGTPPETAPAPTVPPVQPKAPPPAPSEAASAGQQAAPPPTEVLSVPPPPEPAESGLSAIRDVTLAAGVPDLTRGRRPVTPPLARMTNTTGTVEVAFSVDAAGITSVKGSSGPDALKRAAEQAVVSWNFRRTRADRLFLLAEFKYALETATAAIRPDSPR